MFECNYLTVLMKPTYEKPVDTAQNVLDRGLRVINYPGGESVVEMLKNSPYIITRTLAERTIVAKVIFCYISILCNIKFSKKDWDEADTITKHMVLEKGSAVAECPYLAPYEIDWAKERNTRNTHFPPT